MQNNNCFHRFSTADVWSGQKIRLGIQIIWVTIGQCPLVSLKEVTSGNSSSDWHLTAKEVQKAHKQGLTGSLQFDQYFLYSVEYAHLSSNQCQSNMTLPHWNDKRDASFTSWSCHPSSRNANSMLCTVLLCNIILWSQPWFIPILVSGQWLIWNMQALELSGLVRKKIGKLLLSTGTLHQLLAVLLKTVSFRVNSR